MSKEDLLVSLEKLQVEIDKLGEEDGLIKQRASELVDKLEIQIGHEGDSDDSSSLTDSIREFAEQFEVEHPRLTSIINHISVTLSNMGI